MIKNKLSPRFLLPLLIFASSLLLGWQLLRPGYYPMHDDLQVMRLFQIDRCFKDGQVPCRWAPDMGNNYGQPLFNYYSAFPYYLGQFIHLLGFSYVATVKLLFLISLFLSGLFLYLFLIQLVNPAAAFVGALAFMVAPYHALDIFVRGALAEAWGLTLLPALLASLSWLIKKPNSGRSVLVSLSLAAFATSHNITTMIAAPLILIFTLGLLFFSPRPWVRLKYLVTATLLGLGLSAFFLLPLAFERHLISPQSLITDYFDFHAHFTSLKQLFFKTSWGYGPSKFGMDDDLSFFVGLLHLAALVFSPLLIFFSIKKPRQLFISLFFLLLSLVSLFMTHGKSVFIWDSLPPLAFVQFPWRFLLLVTLGTSVVLALLINLIPSKFNLPLVTLTALLLIVLNFNYFKFEKYFYWIDDQQKLSGELYNLQVRAALLDYLPAHVRQIPKSKAPDQPQVLAGQIYLNYFDKRSHYFVTELDVYHQPATIQFPIVYFPNWTLYHNRQSSPMNFTYDNDLGLITVILEPGHHLIQAWLENTPVRTIANLITFLSALTLLTWLIIVNEKKA